MMEDIVKDLTLDYLKDTEKGKNIQKALNVFQKIQESAYLYVTDESSEELKLTRIGTTLTFSILNKLYDKKLKAFTREDWKEIAEVVNNQAIIAGGQEYSILVFETYANYADVSVKVLEAANISEEKRKAISALSDQIRQLEQDLRDGTISELDYTEACLWTLLEAMIKLITAYSMTKFGKEKSEFAEAISMLAFEYGRYALYSKEQEILTAYLEHQYELDIELQDKLADFTKGLQEKQNEFNALIENAFSNDFEQRFKSSISIAKLAGLSDDEILDSIEEVDDYFG